MIKSIARATLARLPFQFRLTGCRYPTGAGPFKLYAGNLVRGSVQDEAGFFGLSHAPRHRRDIYCDLSYCQVDVPEGTVSHFQSEDVFEHICPELIPRLLREVHRVLSPGGHLRLSMPDYRSPFLLERSTRDEAGALLFDPGGGGAFTHGRPTQGAHLWFPVYEEIRAFFDASPFTDVQFLHYYDEEGQAVIQPLDHGNMPVRRTPDFDERFRATEGLIQSMVIDAYKR